MLGKIVVLIFMVSFASGLGVELNCPDDIYVNESFECEVEVEEGDGVYDLKVEADKERNSVLSIWSQRDDSGEPAGEVWQSGYYYLKEFVESDGVVRLRVSEVGRYDIVVKLRQGGTSKEFDVGRIRVEEKAEDDRDQKSDDRGLAEVGEVDKVGVVDLGGEVDVISLDGDDAYVEAPHEYDHDESAWDYVSKDGRVIDWLPYVFCLFLICLVGILAWDRRDGYA